MSGRRPKPTAIKKAEGNPGRRPLNKSEPSAGVFNMDPPENLSEQAKSIWNQIAQLGSKMNVIDQADAIALEMLAQTFAEWRQCQEWIKEKGTYYATSTNGGNKIMRQFPQVSQAADAFRRLKSMLSEFGMTPSSRVRLGSTEGEQDELTQLLDSMARRKESKAKTKKKKQLARN